MLHWRSIRALFSAKKPRPVQQRPRGGVRLGIEALEARDLMAAGLDVALVDLVQFAPATTDVGQIAIVTDSAAAGLITAQAPTRIDATALNRTDIMLDYGAFDISQVLTTTLAPGDHLLSVYGHSLARFQVAVNGTVSYDPALEGILTGQGTNNLKVNGAAITIAAAGLNGDYLTLDHVTFNSDATLETHLLPGRHYLQGYGHAPVIFNVTEAGTIDYDAALEGILGGRGTNVLQVHGAPISIDAAALLGDYQTLDYTAFDGNTPLHTHLLPGRHFLSGYGGDATFFEVGLDGTIAYDPVLEGMLSGRGTSVLQVHGALVHLDASALPGSYVSLDYITLDGDLAHTPRLLPGRHVVQAYGGSAVFFRLTDAGAIDYEADLNGTLAGRGTDSLTIQGLRLTIDPRSLNALSYLSLDYTMFTPDQQFEVRVMPGTHFLYHDTTVSWFTVHADGTVSGDAAAVNTIQVSPIVAKLASIPDAAERLGAALGGEQASASGGYFQLFERGGIYSSAAGTYVLTGDFFQEYQDAGGPAGELGLPTMEAAGLGDIEYLNFENGAIVSAPIGIRVFLGETFTPGVSDEIISYDDVVSDRLNGRIGAWLALNLTLPQLSSDPNAPATLYLNFTGDSRNWWHYDDNGEIGRFAVSIDPFDIDNDTSIFILAEQAFIRNIWEHVVEDFAPFNVNVTTVYPGRAAYSKTIQVDIGDTNIGDTSFVGGGSGFASIGSYTDDAPNFVFVFSEFIQDLGGPDDYSDALANQIATTASHEAGHAFGLRHVHRYGENWEYDPKNIDDKYHPGDGITTPIMGNNLSTIRTTWSDGYIDTVTFNSGEEKLTGGVQQYDVDVLGSVLGLRADDYGDTRATATALPGQYAPGSLRAQGLIGDRSDVDAFSFTTGAGTISIRLDTIARGANLDARIELWSETGGLIATVDPDDRLNAELTTAVAAGDYYVLVASHGGYGDIGQYTLTVNPVFARQEWTPDQASDQAIVPPPSDALQDWLTEYAATEHPQDEAPVAVHDNLMPAPPGPMELYTAPTLNVQTTTAPVETGAIDQLFMTDFLWM